MTEQIKNLLTKVGAHFHPKRELTLFALGGRGHYENPISDLLAFFMDPQAEHKFGTTFLDAFLECLTDKNAHDLPLSGVRIWREAETSGGKRIDLQILGTDWVLLIENKIYHHQVNPFQEYEDHVRDVYPAKRPLLAVLSPSGASSNKKWSGVSYQTYCEKLEARLEVLDFKSAPSKWLVFAHELILHLKNELYSQRMNQEMVQFVEANQAAVAQVEKLSKEYRAFLHEHLRQLLAAELEDSSARTKEDGWAIRCYGSKWGVSNIAWWYNEKDKDRPICLSVYLKTPTADQHVPVRAKFETKEMLAVREGSWVVWSNTKGFTNRQEADQEFIRLAKVVDKMFAAADPPANFDASNHDQGSAIA